MQRMRCCLLLAISLCLAHAAFGLRMVSRDVPEVYKQIEPLLTPIEEVLEGREIFPDSPDGGVILLDENVLYISDEGTSYKVYHSVYYTRKASGIRATERDSISFDKERQRIYLVEAYTIDEKGQRLDLAENAAFLHSPQKESSQSLYTSREELVLVYPGVREGVTTAYTVLIEEHDPVMPGHVASRHVFGAWWPTYKRRALLDMPAAWEERVQVVKRGIGAPDYVREQQDNGRISYVWAPPSYDGAEQEHRAPEGVFTFPSVWYTTVPSWDAVADWYLGLIADRNEPGERLIAACEEATSGLSDRREIIQALTSLASDQVRYTGLEFGLAGYQPYDCNAVWENGYGDCKDKANLLVALLKHKGIEAWVALLNTGQHGLVEQRSPSWNQFSHAIVAIPGPDGSFQLVDPTVEHLRVGDTPQADSARDVLVLTGQGAKWIRSPDCSPRGYHTQFELNLAADGHASGWMDLHETGVNAANVAHNLNRRDKDGRRRYMHDLVEDIFPGAQTLDVEYTQLSGPVSDVRAKAFFEVVAGRASPDAVRFPFPENWLPYVQVEEDRKLPYEAVMQRIESTATFTLEGKQPASLPLPFTAQNESVEIAASWEANAEGKLIAHLKLQPRAQILTPEQYLTFRRAIYALKAWMARPVVLAQGSTNYALGEETEEVEIDFPLLATGQGQLRLLRERYPSGRDDLRRRKALQQILQWFPEDPDTQAEALTSLAMLDWVDEKESDQKFSQALRPILNEYGARIDVHTRSWIEYLEARADFDGNGNLAAIERLVGLLRDVSLSKMRRGWSGYYAATYSHETGNNERAMELAVEAAALDSDATESLNILRADLLLETGEPASVLKLIDELLEHGQNNGDLAVVLNHIHSKWAELNDAQQIAVAKDMAKHREAGILGPEAEGAAGKLIDQGEKRSMQLAMQAQVREALETLKPKFWIPDHEARSMPIDELKKLSGNETGMKGTTLSVHYMLRADTSYDQFVQALYHACWQIKLLDEDIRAPLVKVIDPYLENLPNDETGNLARAISELGKIDGHEERSIELLGHHVSNPRNKEWMRVHAARGQVTLQLGLNDAQGVLATAENVENILSSNKYGTDIACMQLLVHVQRGEFELAREALDRLNQLSQEWLDGAGFRFPVLLYMDESARSGLQEYWSNAQEWWEEWENLCKRYELAPEQASDLLITGALSGWQERVTDAASKNDPKLTLEALRPIIQGLRVHPRIIIDAQHAITSMGMAGDAAFTDARDLYLHITSNWKFGDKDVRLAVGTSRAGFLLDLGRHQEAMTAARIVYESIGSGNEYGDQTLRVWLLAAASLKQAERPIVIMEDVLQAGVEIHDRARSIESLRYVYELLGKKAELRALYERERPYLIEAGQQQVVDRFMAALYAESPFEEVVRAWIGEYCGDWFEEAWPTTLDGIVRSDEGVPMITETGAYATKVTFLAALDSEIGEFVRQMLFASAVIEYVEEGLHPADRTEAIVALLDDERLDPFVSGRIWEWAANGMVRREDTGALARLLDHRIAEQEGIKDIVERRRADLALLQAVKDGGQGLAPAGIARVVNGKLDQPAAVIVARTIQQLVYSGREPEALMIVGAGIRAQATDDNAGGSSSLQLMWKQALRNAQIRQDFHAGYLALLQKHFGPLPTGEPDCFVWTESLEDSDWQSSEELFHALAYAVQSGRMRGGIAHALGYRLQLWGAGRKFSEFHMDLLDLALSTPAQPSVQTPRLTSAIVGIDHDTEEHREVALTKIKALLARPGTPRTVREAVEYLMGRIGARHSRELARMVLFPPKTEDPQVSWPVAKGRIQHLLVQGENEQLEELLDSSFEYSIIDPDGFLMLAMAFETLGRKEEAGLARLSARTSIETSIRDDSLVTNHYFWSSLPEELWLLDAPELLSPGLEKLATRKLGGDWNKRSWACGVALLREDWQTLLDETSSLLVKEPEVYHYYGLRAVAHAELGQFEEARRDLETYRRWNRDESLYLPIIEHCEAILEAAVQTVAR